MWKVRRETGGSAIGTRLATWMQAFGILLYIGNTHILNIQLHIFRERTQSCCLSAGVFEVAPLTEHVIGTLQFM